MEEWLKKFHAQQGLSYFSDTVLSRWANSLDEQSRLILTCYYREGETFKSTAEKVGLSSKRISDVVRKCGHRLRWAERALQDGQDCCMWLLRPGIGGYKDRNFPMLTGQQFADIWNGLPRLGRMAILSECTGISLERTAHSLSVPVSLLHKKYDAAKNMLYVATHPNCLEYGLSTRASKLLQKANIKTRDELEAFVSGGGNLRHISGMGEYTEWEVLAYLGHPIKPISTVKSFDNLPASVRCSLSAAGIKSLEDLERFHRAGFVLCRLKGVDGTVETKLLELLKK